MWSTERGASNLSSIEILSLKKVILALGEFGNYCDATLTTCISPKHFKLLHKNFLLCKDGSFLFEILDHFFFFFFLQLDRSPIIFQNRAWKLPHFWNLPEPKGRAHSEATLVLSSTIWSWEVASLNSANPWLFIFYFLLILLASEPIFSWAHIFFFHENILNETYNKWCRLLVFCFPTSSLWVIFVLWSSF